MADPRLGYHRGGPTHTAKRHPDTGLGGRILLEDLRSIRDEDEERDIMFVASYVNNRTRPPGMFSVALLSIRFRRRTYNLSHIRSSILYHNILDGRPRCRI